MLGIAELVALPFLLAILFQWARAERAQTAPLDRRLDADLAVVVPAPTADHTPVPALERVRPWWETEQNDVAARIRRQQGDA